MNKFKEINIKEGMPLSEDAMNYLKSEIIINVKALELKAKYKLLEHCFRVCNNGITIVEL